MPIYEYQCRDCGFKNEYLQKVSEPPMTVCPSCGKAAFQKQLTAAGFQLKGSGWYATDFRNSSKPDAKASKSEAKASDDAAGGASDEAKSTSASKAEKSTSGNAGGKTPASTAADGGTGS